MTSPDVIARQLRLNIVPLLIPVLFKFRAARRYMFRTISQTGVNYRGSRLSEGCAGTVHGGDRLPWVVICTRLAGGVMQLSLRRSLHGLTGSAQYPEQSSAVISYSR